MTKKRELWQKAFTQGYVCAVSVLIQSHGEGTEVDDVIRNGGITLKECTAMECEPYDIEILRPTLERLEARK